MDVEDKTRFVFPAGDGSSKNPDASGMKESGSDHTVLAASAPMEPVLRADRNNNSYFSASRESKGNIVRDKHFSLSSSEHTRINVLTPPADRNPARDLNQGAENTVVVSSLRAAEAMDQAAGRQQSIPENKAIKNRFELIDLVGVGGMGAVYKAADRRKIEADDRDPYVAIKVLNDDFRNHPDAFIALQREARKSQTLAHPNIVNVYDFDRDGDMVFMTMEFLKGSPLDVLLRDQAGMGLPLAQALAVLKDIASALMYAHSHHIVHSDFKPGNIYVTDDKGAKVFDFGISRAVNPGGYLSPGKDAITVFDAGSLGALTPAYASLEMLQGLEPLPSDDVYALACVAYEMFGGGHPFEKMPADKAMQQGLKPKKIRHLSRRQWRALKQALAFTRSQRTASVAEFVRQFYGSTRVPAWLGLIPLGILAVTAGYYSIQPKANIVDETVIKEELQEELQQTLIRTRAADRLATLDRMLHAQDVSARWESDLRAELADYQQLMPADLDTPLLVQQRAAEKLLLAARDLLDRNEIEHSGTTLIRASEWGASEQSIDEISRLLEQKRQEEQARLARQQEEELQRLNAVEVNKTQALLKQQVENRNRMLTEAMARIENALHCSTSMDIAGTLTAHWQSLSQLDRALAQRLMPDVVGDLGNCLVHLQQTQPEKAEALLAEAKVLFPQAEIFHTLRIDHCAHLQPGSGSRGDRFTCQDKLASGGEGPVLVVVNGPTKGKLAMGKYEVSTADMKAFCVRHGECGNLGRLAQHLPAHNVPVELAQQYLQWLSAESGYRYRLPTEQEWMAATVAGSQQEDPDRNCHLRFGAIQKGAELVSVTTGKPNFNGLMNAVGNVQEWALSGSNGSLLAMGGSREDPMSRCLASTRKAHNGSADPTTGFRVVRQF